MHQEGLPVSLTEESQLDSSGILVGRPGSTRAYGLSDEDVQLFQQVACAGTGGLLRSKIPKHLQGERVLALELKNLVAWERDARGRVTYLVLTWAGKEAWDAARAATQAVPATQPQSWSARRRRTL